VVLHEMEHIVVDALQPLLYPVNGDGTTLSAYQVAQGVVKQNFVIEEIKGTLIQVSSVWVGIIDFSDKNDLRIYGLHLGYYPVPGFDRNHLRHGTTKAIYLAVCTEDDDVFHLVPGVRPSSEGLSASSLDISTVIEFDRFEPGVNRGIGPELVVGGCLRR